VRLDTFRAALTAFFERRAVEIQKNIDNHAYADHRALWLARRAELELVRRFARTIDPRKGDPDDEP
jgi:hypothetical protein